MENTVKLQCQCGKVQGKLTIDRKASFHVHCLCCDCQSFAKHLGNEDKILNQHGGSELLQTYPDLVQIDEGIEHISAVKLSEKGLYRWHTTCCNMPVANTMTSASVPFIGVSVKMMQFSNEQEKLETLGPVQLKAFGRHAIGEMPEDTHEKFPLSFMPKIMGFMLKGALGKRAKGSPLFDGKNPIASVKLLD